MCFERWQVGVLEGGSELHANFFGNIVFLERRFARVDEIGAREELRDARRRMRRLAAGLVVVRFADTLEEKYAVYSRSREGTLVEEKQRHTTRYSSLRLP